MKYKNAVNDFFDRLTPVTDADTLFENVKRRAAKTAPARSARHIRKKAVITAAAAAAAIAVGAVGAGASINWDMTKVLLDTNEQRRLSEEENKAAHDEMIRSIYPYIDSINVPEGVTAGTGNSESDMEIAQRITYPSNRKFEYDGYTAVLKGTAFDGYAAQIYFDVIYTDECLANGGPENLNGVDVRYGSPVLPTAMFSKNGEIMYGFGTSDHELLGINGNTYSWCMHYSFYPRTDADTIYVSLTKVNDIHGYPTKDLTSGKYGTISELNDVSDLKECISVERETELIGLGSAYLKRIVITPLSLRFIFDGAESCDLNYDTAVPVFVTLDNGEVIDLTERGFRSTKDNLTDENILQVMSFSHILNSGRIKSIQLFNEVIDISGAQPAAEEDYNINVIFTSSPRLYDNEDYNSTVLRSPVIPEEADKLLEENGILYRAIAEYRCESTGKSGYMLIVMNFDYGKAKKLLYPLYEGREGYTVYAPSESDTIVITSGNLTIPDGANAFSLEDILGMLDSPVLDSKFHDLTDAKKILDERGITCKIAIATNQANGEQEYDLLTTEKDAPEASAILYEIYGDNEEYDCYSY